MIRNLMFVHVVGLILLSGCNTGGGGGGGGAGEGGGNSDTTTPTDNLLVTFSPPSGFPQGEDPATFEIGDGSITASGGTAGTLGATGLYADDLFAWDFFAGDGSGGSMTFDGLAVLAIEGYWVHRQDQTTIGTMTVNFSGGGSQTVDSAAVDPFGALGQAQGFFDTVTAPDGETITDLAFGFADGAEADDLAVLVVLELTVSDG